MKRFLLSLTVTICACIANAQKPATGLPPYQAPSKALHDTIVKMDSLFFDAYNTGKLAIVDSLFSTDIEFYHDRGGLSTSKTDLVKSVEKNIFGKVRRELLAGSIEVYPIPNFGAVQIGAHRFHNLVEGIVSPYARFATIWKQTGNSWQMVRVISLH